MSTQTREPAHTVRFCVIVALTAILSVFVGVVVMTAEVSAQPPSADQVKQAQYVLISHGYAVGPVDGVLGPRTRSAVAGWQRSNRLYVDGIPGPVTLSSLVASVPATGGRPAVRLNPPAAQPVSVEQMIRDVWPDDLEDRAVAIAFRESRFVPTVRTWCCYGVFQIHVVHLAQLGLTSAGQLYDPLTNVVAAYMLYQIDGWHPWAT